MAPIYFIAGPTACGKTLAAVKLAQRIGGEVVSADSMQAYRYMDIGTAKPTEAEMEGVPHHLISVVDPDASFSAAVFADMAKEAIADISSRNRAPIICGGTGFYLSSLLYGAEFGAGEDLEARERYWALAREKGNSHVHDLLKKVDPESANAIHPNNAKRVIRALEYYDLTGNKISEHNKAQSAKAPIEGAKLLLLSMPREVLHNRIDARVDRMFEQGLVEEVQGLLRKGYGKGLRSMLALGYKETIAYLEGAMSKEDCIALIKQSTRQFSKRQYTWFRHKTDGLWIDVEYGIEPVIEAALA
ncbi:MAG: tRNA (adenosine(37)-N6)-dimethylallyltransferase MiaA [Clostridiales bacterium]|jgi:tRNA dimethylallyltransferase|nr:tRNA (adenosine(37)-N6)-dimethylallyltransferase MiaA [Clostridiales bacterium]MDR2751074.1 tRNA (adenosine(37)-N6)-dimethylallyltransferase MiaA [Clostridiales bacterium]